MAQATLIKDGNKVAVESGSSQAQQLFGQGYTLMGATPAAPAVNPSIPSGQMAVPAGKTSEYQINGQFGQTGQAGSGLYGVPKTSNLTVNKELLNSPVPTSVNNSAAPSVNDLPKIYRIGADIYDANTQQKIGATQFAKDYSGKAMEVAAPAAPVVPEAPKAPEVPVEKPLTAADRISTFYKDYTTGAANAKSQATVDSGLGEALTFKTQANIDLNNARTAMQNANILDQKALDAMEGQGRGITTGIIGNQQAKLSREQKLDFALLQNDYNNKLVSYQIAQGAYDDAKETVKNTADDFYRNATLQLSILQEQNGIEQKAADRLQTELTYERDLAKEGYVAINNPADLAKFKESEIFRDPASGKVYLKPKPTIKSTITANNHVYGIDENGNVLKDFGTADENKSRFTQTGTDENGYPTYGFVNEEAGTIIPAQGNPNGNPSGDPSQVTGDIGSFMTAISGKESGGNYDAKNGRTGASGRFQILPSNWPSWSQAYARDVLGKSIGNMPMTPENQDAVAQYKMQEYYNKYGNWADVASMWYSGRPLSQVKAEGWADKKNGAGNEPSVNEYVNDIMSRMSKSNPNQSGNLTSAQQTALDIFNGTGSLSGVSTKNNLQARVGTELAKLKQQAIVSGDIEGLMRASAGGKDLDATTVTSLEKAVNVVGQIDDLSKVIDKEATGPIMGIIRSNNPYDSKAQLINAQLTAIVPNLARGIYGEVGVLTDNDVALYAKTLPNLKSTEEVKNLILGATIRSVQRSIENKMKIQAGAGRDVSGLIDTYKAVKSMADRLSGGASSNSTNIDFTQFYK